MMIIIAIVIKIVREVIIMVIAVIEVIIMNDDHDRSEYPVRGGGGVITRNAVSMLMIKNDDNGQWTTNALDDDPD